MLDINCTVVVMDIELGSSLLFLQESEHFLDLVSGGHIQSLRVHPVSIILFTILKNALGKVLIKEGVCC